MASPMWGAVAAVMLQTKNVYICTYVHVCTHTHMHTCTHMHTMHTHAHNYTYTHSYIHAYIHTYVHTHICMDVWKTYAYISAAMQPLPATHQKMPVRTCAYERMCACARVHERERERERERESKLVSEQVSRHACV